MQELSWLLMCGVQCSTCHFQSTHDKVWSLLPKHSTKINGGLAQNHWRPECVCPDDRLAKFVRCCKNMNIDGGVTKNHWRPECVWPEANKVCSSQSQKHSVKLGLIAKTQRERKPHHKTQREGRPCCKTQREHKPHCKNTLQV